MSSEISGHDKEQQAQLLLMSLPSTMSDEAKLTFVLSFLPAAERKLFMEYFGDSRGFIVAPVWWFCYALATALFAMRLYARLAYGPTGRLRFDDWLQVASFITLSGTMACVWMVYINGLGQGPLKVIQLAQIETILKNVWAGSILYLASFSFSKFSLVALYWMLLGNVKRARKYLIPSTAFILVSSVFLTIWKIFSCVPLRRQYTVLGNGFDMKCHWSNCIVLYSAYGINAVSDFILIGLAFPLLNGLRLPRREKMGVFTIFSLTAFIIVASTIRVAIIRATKDLLMIITWSFIEAALALVVTSIPSLKAIFSRVIKGQAPGQRERKPSRSWSWSRTGSRSRSLSRSRSARSRKGSWSSKKAFVDTKSGGTHDEHFDIEIPTRAMVVSKGKDGRFGMVDSKHSMEIFAPPEPNFKRAHRNGRIVDSLPPQIGPLDSQIFDIWGSKENMLLYKEPGIGQKIAEFDFSEKDPIEKMEQQEDKSKINFSRPSLHRSRTSDANFLAGLAGRESKAISSVDSENANRFTYFNSSEGTTSMDSDRLTYLESKSSMDSEHSIPPIPTPLKAVPHAL